MNLSFQKNPLTHRITILQDWANNAYRIEQTTRNVSKKLDHRPPQYKFRNHKDGTKTGGGLLLYVNENLPGKIINSYKFKENSEIIVFEFSVSNKKWLLLGNYKPPSQNDLSFMSELNLAPPSQNHLSFISELNLALNFFSPIYEICALLGDFNLSPESPNLKNFMCSCDPESLIKPLTCYKSTYATYIDLILTNKKESFDEVTHVWNRLIWSP